MEPRYATVVRDARRQRIDLARVVPGDIVVLAAGDRVPADIELLVVNGLQVDESVLTGESLPVDKLVPTTVEDDDNGRAFAGTVVTNGRDWESSWRRAPPARWAGSRPSSAKRVPPHPCNADSAD